VHQPPDPNSFDNGRQNNTLGDTPELFDTSETDPDRLPPEGGTSATPALRRLYVVLLVLGLTIGTVVAFGVVNLLERLGLTEVQQVD